MLQNNVSGFSKKLGEVKDKDQSKNSRCRKSKRGIVGSKILTKITETKIAT